MTLRHKDATRQAWLYGIFPAVIIAVIVVSFLMPVPGRWWTLALAPIAVVLAYFSVRMATLSVRLDSTGVWEPNPFRLTYVTPWKDVAQVRKISREGAGRTRFLGIEIVHAGGETHQVAALMMQARAAYAEPTVDGWVDQIRQAKKAHT